MRRVITPIIIVMVALLLAAVTSQVVFAQAETPTPETVPVQSLGAGETSPATTGGGGFFAGLKRFAENAWNLVSNPEKQASSSLDLAAMLLGGGSEGLEGLAQKIKNSDLFMPRFSENAVWEVWVQLLMNLAWALARLAIPVFFLGRIIGWRRESIASFVLGLLGLLLVLSFDLILFKVVSMVFRMIIDSLGINDSQTTENLKMVVDALWVSVSNGNLLALVAVLGAGGLLYVAVIRYLITLLTLIVLRIFTPLRLTRDLVFGRPKGAVSWLAQILANFTELTIFWVSARLLLTLLAEAIPPDWVWAGIMPAVLVLVFLPYWLTKGLFEKVATTVAANAGIEVPASREVSIGQRVEGFKQGAGRLGHEAWKLLPVLANAGLDIYQQQRIEQEAEVDRGQQAAIEDLERRVDAAEQGTPPPNVQVAVAQPTSHSQGSLPKTPATRAVVAGASLATAEQLLKKAGVKVAPHTIKAAGAAAVSALGTISAPVAITAVVVAGLLGLSAAGLWITAQQLSTHRKRYERYGDLAQLSVEAAAETERKARERRKAAATVRRPHEGGAG